MDDQLNNELKNRINEVFDRFEVPEGAADAGWTELRKRFPAQKRRNAAAWWWSSAAAVLVLVVLGIWLYHPAQPVHPQMAQHHPVKPLVQQPGAVDSGVIVHRFPLPITPQLAAQAGAIKAQKGNPLYNVPDFSNRVYPGKINPAYAVVTRQPKAIDSAQSTSLTAMQQASPGLVIVSPVDSGASMAATLAANPPVTTSTTDAAPVKAPEKVSGMEQLFTREAAMAKNATPNIKPAATTSQRLALSVYAGTFINYAKGSSNEVNVGAGITSDIKLTKRFKLVTGVAIAQNKLNFDNQPSDGKMYAAAVAATGGPDVSVLNTTAFFSPAVSARNTTEITGYNANFTGLDIPLNIKYEFGKSNSDTYVLAGVSSGTFINETYRYSYSSSLFNSISQTAETQTRFSSFDFARTLNIAFGVGTPVGKTNRLIIEPFLKYPISGMGSQQIRFGASGINLKFKFLSH
jgi:hypothetical protein